MHVGVAVAEVVGGCSDGRGDGEKDGEHEEPAARLRGHALVQRKVRLAFFANGQQIFDEKTIMKNHGEDEEGVERAKVGDVVQVLFHGPMQAPDEC